MLVTRLLAFFQSSSSVIINFSLTELFDWLET